MLPGSVITVAVNGYDRIYSPFIKTHRQYADRHGYRHVTLTAPTVRASRHDAAWVKLELLAEELDSGAERVLLVDADSKIQDRAPSLVTLGSAHDAYAARGRSGRWNSGVLVFTNTPSARALLGRILDSAETPVPEDEWNGWKDWGENGHVIHHFDRHDSVSELPAEWNNSTDPELADFIRHHTGPLSLKNSLPTKLRRRFARKRVAQLPALDGDRDVRLNALTGMAERSL